jgi:hypothetical protein
MRWWRRIERERDLERELNSDLELEGEEQQDNGLSAEEALYAARRAYRWRARRGHRSAQVRAPGRSAVTTSNGWRAGIAT